MGVAADVLMVRSLRGRGPKFLRLDRGSPLSSPSHLPPQLRVPKQQALRARVGRVNRGRRGGEIGSRIGVPLPTTRPSTTYPPGERETTDVGCSPARIGRLSAPTAKPMGNETKRTHRTFWLFAGMFADHVGHGEALAMVRRGPGTAAAKVRWWAPRWCSPPTSSDPRVDTGPRFPSAQQLVAESRPCAVAASSPPRMTRG